MANIIPDDRWVVEDDGLFCQEVGPWAETKHNLVSYYGRLFSTGMKNKWDRRIYIELYAGAGYSRIRETLRIVAGSPLRALLLPHPFDRYIFCEKDSVSIESLKVRVKRIAPRADVVFIPGDEPFQWNSPKLVFVNSMSDLFHTAIPDEYVEGVSQVMTIADWHTYQVLTKRSERLCGLLNGRLRFAADRENIWWGVSVEDRKHGLPRVAHLAQASAKVRFLSIEPLLEDLGKIDLSGIDWVIVGGESGPGAPPMNKEWVVSIREQCKAAGVAFFFKQWGGTRKSLNGRKLEGRTYEEYPERVHHPVLAAQECLARAAEFEAAYKRTNLIPISGLSSLPFELALR